MAIEFGIIFMDICILNYVLAVPHTYIKHCIYGKSKLSKLIKNYNVSTG
jgi:hypothetical protein